MGAKRLYANNLLLASFSAADSAAIRPHLKLVRLAHKQVLFEAGSLIGTVYFPISAIISLVIKLTSGETVEAAMVGRDGVVAASAALDGTMSLNGAVVELEGDSLVCDPGALKGAALQSHTMLSTLIRHEQTLFAQAQQSTACIATHDVEARLCRWILRARDLAGRDHLPLSADYLAEMLGVPHSSVALTAHTLQQAGLIRYARGTIKVVDAEGLREAACECYDAVKSHYQTMFGDRSKD